jgi:benzoyl-CoA reductase/2-hydroxyglutaryl-CoA dehydratase subunit BcrC/BadD/HgdB
LEDWSGRKLDPGKLKEAVALYNQRRAVLRELYELRKTNPPLVSGTEITKALVAGMGIPAAAERMRAWFWPSAELWA